MESNKLSPFVPSTAVSTDKRVVVSHPLISRLPRPAVRVRSATARHGRRGRAHDTKVYRINCRHAHEVAGAALHHSNESRQAFPFDGALVGWSFLLHATSYLLENIREWNQAIDSAYQRGTRVYLSRQVRPTNEYTTTLGWVCRSNQISSPNMAARRLICGVRISNQPWMNSAKLSV
jgi:hypothetical protein